MITIIDYGVGNLTSIKNMLKKCGAEVTITSDLALISNATKFVLPGVGSFDHGITNLRATPYFSILQEKVLQEKIPLLGICLGAQLLADSSEEGLLPGLGWIRGKIIRFNKERMNAAHLKVPHMGWSDVNFQKSSALFTGMHADPRFYFVHSYHWECADPADELLSADYGYTFTAGVEKENILGLQFHPEKSHKYGLRVYENFVKNY